MFKTLIFQGFYLQNIGIFVKTFTLQNKWTIKKQCIYKCIYTVNFERFIAFLTCQRLDSLLVELRKSKLELIRKYKPCLFCLNDSLKTTDDDRLAMRKFLEEKFPKASSFEKSVEEV